MYQVLASNFLVKVVVWKNQSLQTLRFAICNCNYPISLLRAQKGWSTSNLWKEGRKDYLTESVLYIAVLIIKRRKVVQFPRYVWKFGAEPSLPIAWQRQHCLRTYPFITGTQKKNNLHPHITDNILSSWRLQELFQNLEGMQECVWLVIVIWAAITTVCRNEEKSKLQPDQPQSQRTKTTSDREHFTHTGDL